MHLNTLSPVNRRTKATRVGRGWSSGKGKTCGRGTKGQHARNTVKQGFEGGQTPFQRRVPKFGFTSWREKYSAEIGTDKLAKVDAEMIDLDALKAANLIRNHIRFVKIIAAGEVNKTVKISGIKVTQGAKQLITSAGGSVE